MCVYRDVAVIIIFCCLFVGMPCLVLLALNVLISFHTHQIEFGVTIKKIVKKAWAVIMTL